MASLAADAATKSLKGLPATSKLDGKAAEMGLRIAIVRTRWNSTIVDALSNGAYDELLKLGVAKENITVMEVPGSYELVYGNK